VSERPSQRKPAKHVATGMSAEHQGRQAVQLLRLTGCSKSKCDEQRPKCMHRQAPIATGSVLTMHRWTLHPAEC